MTDDNGIGRARQQSDRVDWLVANDDENLSRRRFATAIVELSENISELRHDFLKHLTHPYAHAEPTDRRGRVQQWAAEHPVVVAGGTGAGAIGIIEAIVRLLG